MTLDRATRDIILGGLGTSRNTLAASLSRASDDWDLVTKLEDVIRQIRDYDFAQSAPAENALPALIINHYNLGENYGYYAIPETPAVISYLMNPVRRKSRPDLDAEMLSLAETIARRNFVRAVPSLDDIKDSLDTRAIRLNGIADAIFSTKVERLLPFAIPVNKLASGVNFTESGGYGKVYRASDHTGIVALETYNDNDEDESN